MNRIRWVCGEIRWFIIRCLHIITHKYFTDDSKYGKNELHSAEEGNDKIRQLILSDKPFAFCRFSFVEYDLMIRCKTEEYFGIKSYALKKDLVDMYRSEKDTNQYQGIHKFNAIMLEALCNTDVLGVWRNIPMGDVYIDTIKDIDKKYMTNAIAVEPYAFSAPWSKMLEGKKVLVVSPFSKEIRRQYLKKEYLWDNKDILPQFELETVDSVWYFFGCKDGRFSDWFEALEYLYKETMKMEFDIALLGCGPFGFPLAAMIKKAGRQAIHMGGAVQLLFGIKGKRWDNTGISKFYNDFWIRAGEDTKPSDAEKLDNNCYW